MRKILEKCPACESELIVTQLSCTNCETVIVGRFKPNIFSRLSPEDLDFIVHFVRNKGNVKEMERELDISYWTIRNRLNDIVQQLGWAAESGEIAEAEENTTGENAAQRLFILEQLNSGLMTVQEATIKLAQLKERK